MISTSLAFLLALLISAVLTPLVRDFAVRRKLAAVPRADRDVHVIPIPRLGGLAIAIGFMVPLIGLFVFDTGIGSFIQRDPEWLDYVFALGGGSLAIVGLGLYDDLRGANAYQKLAVQILVAGFVWGLGVRIDIIGLFGTRIETGVLSLPITIFWILVVINAMNLIDGLDGLASGVALMAILPNLVLGIYNHNVVMMVLMAALGGAILGFLIYNFRPASIFMGDSGSMFLGFVLATGSVLDNVKASATVSMIAPVLALGLPIMDTLLAVFRRSMQGTHLFHADNDHVHHRLMKRGMSHRQAVLVLYGVSFFLAAGAIGSVFMRGKQAAVLILVLAVGVGFFIRRLGYLWTLPMLPRRPGAQAWNAHLRAVCADVRETEDVTAIWRAMQPVRRLLAVRSLELAIGEERFSWASERRVAAGSTRIDVIAEGRAIGQIVVEWRQRPRNEEEGKALHLLVEAIGDALARIRSEEATPPTNVIPLPRRVSGSV